MDFVKKFRELKNKRCATLKKESERRGLRTPCETSEEIACEIVAYDAYHAGRSAALEEVRKGNNNVASTTVKERSGIVLKDDTNDDVVFLKVTKDQMNLLDYLIDHDWLTDVSYTETKQIEWDEP